MIVAACLSVSTPLPAASTPISLVTSQYVKEIFAGLLDREIVVSCHAGIRSYNFCQWCLDNNIVSEIWNLEEGIDGWSRNIDPSIPRY